MTSDGNVLILRNTLINKNIKILNKYLVNHIPNNNDGKKHTLNQTIQILKKDKENIFDLNLINKFLKRGAKANNNNTINNTLTLALTYAKQYIEYHKSKNAEECMISFIQLLIKGGSEPSNAQDQSNTLSTVIRTRSLKLINIIAELNSFPDNNQYGGLFGALGLGANTLTIAVNTCMIDIVKIVCNIGSLPDFSNKFLSDRYNKNTLFCAIMTKNLEIVKEIIFVGGKCERNYFYVEENNFDDEIFVNIINLLLCSGTKVERINNKYNAVSQYALDKNSSVSQYLFNKMNSYIVLSQCFRMRYATIISIDDEIDKLRHKLKYTMDELIAGYETRYFKKMDIINILIYMPTCCVDIICSYSHQQPFQIIDWMNREIYQ